MSHIVSMMQHPVNVDHSTRTIRPVFSEGDDFFGLSRATAGGAAIVRRACLGFDGYQWVRSCGAIAAGVWYAPAVEEQTDFECSL